MIDIIQEYWKSLLWTDGYRFTGVAITLWLLISSVVMGGILAVSSPLAECRAINLSSSPSGCSPISFAARRCTSSCWCSIPECTRLRSSKAQNC
ncbi:Histidine ABC transporter [Klebsiella michiganensis]|nr:Histidine ABC transporter [Klebsiella michiganensis]